MKTHSVQVIRDYSSDSDTYSNNISECESENCSDYGSDYESDTETTIKTPTPQPPNIEKQIFNSAYFTEKAKEGISLLDTYTREELTDKLVIQVERSEYKKFFVVDDISEVYGLPRIHESISGELPLRAVIDIDASREYMESKKVNARGVFTRICCSYIKALYMILDCSWEEIFEGLIIATSSDSSKCSYHLLYVPALLIDYQELKQFTELVYKLTEEKYGKFIDRGLPGRNFCLRLIGSAKKDRVKRILQFSLDNGWNDLNDVRVQPPTSSEPKFKNWFGLEPKLKISIRN
ncbi:hypothetical protein Glove_202g90 [Diversispora epigaea]|uniref:Uncharacterized protein n=1 Tax=Diversispora epigaea TaxID=1348612 RepID=A0A397IJK0_9GLOM|nr:hypothetical protein Glove_202g90 [Diversispora epigaea]